MARHTGVNRILIAAAISVLAGCASAPAPVATPEAMVVNKTGKALGSVQYQPCGANGEWAPLAGSALAAGASLRLTLPAACTDLNAYYADGKLAGQQRGVKREFPFEWALY